MVPMNLPPVVKSPIGVGRHMPRDRYQRGWVEQVGKNLKKWRGHYYVYLIGTDGIERRHHKTATLGYVARMKKSDAMKELADVIERETRQTASTIATLNWFWEQRYLPLHGSSLKESSQYHLKWVMDKHVLAKFGDTPISAIDRFAMQAYLNSLAEKYGSSLIHKIRTYLNAVLEEALYQGFVKRNEAALLEKPKVEERDRRFLRPEACKRLLDATTGRDNLIMRLLLFCGLRPGELFALRWDDWEPGALQIDERIWQGRLSSPKTRRSASYVALPEGLDKAITDWKKQCGEVDLRDWMFPGENGRSLTAGTWLRENLKPLAKGCNVAFVNFQVLRRTFATLIQKHGSVKDAQAQLRHASPNLTVGVYMQAIPESVKEAVNSFEQAIEAIPKESDTIQ